MNCENLPWRAMVWILGGLIAAPVLYLLSWGFALYYVVRFDLAHPTDETAIVRHHAVLKRIYEPFITHTPPPLSEAFTSYGNWWAELAVRQYKARVRQTLPRAEADSPRF
jgi:hypothetical protein